MALAASARTPLRLPASVRPKCITPCPMQIESAITTSSIRQPSRSHIPAAAIRQHSQRRNAHTSVKSVSRLVPAPTPFVSTPAAFLTLIGRQMSQHAAKFESWESLFGSSSERLKEMGIEPARNRRYLLWWVDQFRRGRYGIGGDLTHVSSEGVGEVRIRRDADGGRVAVNVPVGSTDLAAGKPVKGVAVDGPGLGRILGSHFLPVKGGNNVVAQLKVSEGIWEVKRGRKIHGGERRRKNVLSRIAARARGTLT